jgi:hypothetical protein
MARELFYVFRLDPEGRTPRWTVRKGDETYGEYLDQTAAILDAVEAAQEALGRGDEAHVVVDDGGGRSHLEWSSAPAAAAIAASALQAVALPAA